LCPADEVHAEGRDRQDAMDVGSSGFRTIDYGASKFDLGGKPVRTVLADEVDAIAA